MEHLLFESIDFVANNVPTSNVRAHLSVCEDNETVIEMIILKGDALWSHTHTSICYVSHSASCGHIDERIFHTGQVESIVVVVQFLIGKLGKPVAFRQDKNRKQAVIRKYLNQYSIEVALQFLEQLGAMLCEINDQTNRPHPSQDVKPGLSLGAALFRGGQFISRTNSRCFVVNSWRRPKAFLMTSDNVNPTCAYNVMKNLKKHVGKRD